MPTSYTAHIQDNEDVTFADFVWLCARQFGALAHLREDKFEVPSLVDALRGSGWGIEYHEAELARATGHLAALEAMSPDQVDARRVREFEKSRALHAEGTARSAALRRRYERILAVARDWNPPTENHESLRAFMVQQITESISWDCATYPAPEEENLDEYRARTLASAREKVEYHRKELAQAIDREAERRAWVTALDASVPNPRRDERAGEAKSE